MNIEELRSKSSITRSDISALLVSIGTPGEKQQEKIEAVKSLNRRNGQGFNISETLHAYSEF